MEAKRDVCLSLLVNITGQHYAGYRSRYVEDRKGRVRLLERDQLP